MPNLANGLRQAYDVQDFAFELLRRMQDELKTTGVISSSHKDAAQAVGTVVRAWEAAQERIAFHRRVGPPASVRVAPKRTRSKRAVLGSTSATSPEDKPQQTPLSRPSEPTYTAEDNGAPTSAAVVAHDARVVVAPDKPAATNDDTPSPS